MPQREEPKWEVVDEIPGERRKEQIAAVRKKLFKSKPLWIGVAVGALAVILFPPLLASAVLVARRLAAAWWLWLAIGLYWYWRRRSQRR